MLHSSPPDKHLYESHPRSFEANRYVYPVLSRRAGGISLGINLSPDKFCNFHCIYCQVDRTVTERQDALDMKRLAEELQRMIELAVSGRLYAHPRFRDVPPPLRRLNDIALSGDGKPPPTAELEAYCDRLREIVSGGGRIKLVQVHTIARPSAETWAAALSNAKLDAIAELVRRRTGLAVATFS